MAFDDTPSEATEPGGAGMTGPERRPANAPALTNRPEGAVGAEGASGPAGTNGHSGHNGIRKSARTRRRILDAAAKVFRERGYSGARLADIAAEAGMQAGSLYYHFDSREALVEEVMRVGGEHSRQIVVARLDSLPADTGPLERLEAAIVAHLMGVLEISDYASATIKLIGQVPDDIRERQLVDQRAYGGMWRTLLEAGVAAGVIRGDVNLSVIRMAILGALNWSVEWYHPDGSPPETIAADIATVVLEGLVVRDRPTTAPPAASPAS
jgi:AcrR family transcriptional regulator